jgi:hypothetical protein
MGLLSKLREMQRQTPFVATKSNAPATTDVALKVWNASSTVMPNVSNVPQKDISFQTADAMSTRTAVHLAKYKWLLGRRRRMQSVETIKNVLVTTVLALSVPHVRQTTQPDVSNVNHRMALSKQTVLAKNVVRHCTTTRTTTVHAANTVRVIKTRHSNIPRQVEMFAKSVQMVITKTQMTIIMRNVTKTCALVRTVKEQKVKSVLPTVKQNVRVVLTDSIYLVVQTLAKATCVLARTVMAPRVCHAKRMTTVSARHAMMDSICRTVFAKSIQTARKMGLLSKLREMQRQTPFVATKSNASVWEEMEPKALPVLNKMRPNVWLAQLMVII